MRIGVRAHDFGRRGAAELSRVIREAGFETVQLALTKAIEGVGGYGDVTDETLRAVREGFAEGNLRIDVLGCYIEPSLADETARLEQVSIFQKALAWARVLGAPVVATETTGFRGDESEREAAFARLKDSVTRMVGTAEREGVTVGIEPVAAHTLNRPALARRLLDEIGSAHLKIVLDPVNLLTADNLHRQAAIIDEAFALLGADIAALHLKDVDGGMNRTNIGEGVVDMERIFRHLRTLGKDIPVLREEVRMDSFAKDIDAIKKLLQGG